MMLSRKEERLKYLGFDDFWMMIIGIPVMSLFILVAFFLPQQEAIAPIDFFYYYLGVFINTIVYWVIFRNVFLYMRKRYFGFEYTRKRILYIVLIVIVFCGISSPLMNEFLDKYMQIRYIDHSLLQGYLGTYFPVLFIVSIYEGIYLYDQNKENIVAREESKREHIISELQGLRNQVNPHFLFNSLNTLTNIIQEDKVLATSFLKKLSDVYRYLLEKRDNHMVTLREELHFIESYVFLQKERFKNNLSVDIEISDHFLDKYLLPLSLQILFENSIKHNVISSRRPLTIEVYIDESQYLVIKNNLQPKKQKLPSTGVGLQNIISRLGYFSDRKIKIEETATDFMVRLPLIDQTEILKRS